jgi:hypothetical protein
MSVTASASARQAPDALNGVPDRWRLFGVVA